MTTLKSFNVNLGNQNRIVVTQRTPPPRTLNIVEKVREKKASVVDPEDWNIN